MSKYYPYPARAEVKQTVTELDPLTRLGLMSDEGEVFVCESNKLFKSDSLYRNKQGTLIHTFVNAVLTAKRMDNGKIIVLSASSCFIVDDSVSPAQVRETHSGWGGAGAPVPDLRTFDIVGKIGIVGTYGTYPSGYVWVTLDFGETWELVWNDPFDDQMKTHIHAVHVDPYRNYLFFSVGDDANTDVLYSKDYGNTWERIFNGIKGQPTELQILPDCILMGSDANPDGVQIVPFEKGRPKPNVDMKNAHFVPTNKESLENTMLGWFYHGANDLSEYPFKVVMVFQGRGAHTDYGDVLYSYDGYNYFVICGNVPEKTPSEGDVKISYLHGITPKGFEIEGELAEGIAWGIGQVFTAGVWKTGIVEIKLPRWVKVD